jgi:hypothetical protein
VHAALGLFDAQQVERRLRELEREEGGEQNRPVRDVVGRVPHLLVPPILIAQPVRPGLHRFRVDIGEHRSEAA